MNPVLMQIAAAAGWFVAMVVVMSIVEHQVHCRLMHKTPRLAFLKNLRARQRIFTSHAVEHHTQYRKEFHDDPVPHGEDRGIRLNLLEGLIESLPLVVVLSIWPATRMGAVMFPFVVCLHHTIWNLIHMEMHKPEKRFFSNWAAYKWAARHHFLHHRYPDKNFNVAFPIGDFIYGTIAKPTEADWEAMRAEGIADGPARGQARRAA
ncbi:MAG: hypothetical protein ACKO1M_04925 [Planctomycetota bacterium]